MNKIYACRLLLGKLDGERPLGRSRSRQMSKTKGALREIGWVGMDWTDLA
jgi:hypothetical protein